MYVRKTIYFSLSRLKFQFFDFVNTYIIASCMYPLHDKDVLIGILVAYVAIDLLLAYAIRTRHPGVLSSLMSALSDENVGVVLIIGMATGLLAYYISRKSREHFSIKQK